MYVYKKMTQHDLRLSLSLSFSLSEKNDFVLVHLPSQLDLPYTYYMVHTFNIAALPRSIFLTKSNVIYDHVNLTIIVESQICFQKQIKITRLRYEHKGGRFFRRESCRGFSLKDNFGERLRYYMFEQASKTEFSEKIRNRKKYHHQVKQINR